MNMVAHNNKSMNPVSPQFTLAMQDRVDHHAGNHRITKPKPTRQTRIQNPVQSQKSRPAGNIAGNENPVNGQTPHQPESNKQSLSHDIPMRKPPSRTSHTPKVQIASQNSQKKEVRQAISLQAGHPPCRSPKQN